MKILILGAGSVGTYIGAKLALSGGGSQEVVFLNRHEDYCKQINENGCTLIEKGKTFAAKAKAFLTIPLAFEKETKFDLAVLCVKSFSTKPLLNDLAPHFSAIGHFLSVQNGVGSEEDMLSFLSAEKITAGSLTTACLMESPGRVEALNKGGIALASLAGARPFEPVTNLFRRANFKIIICPDWKAMKWSKLFLNIIANATCAILDMTPEEIFSHKLAFKLERKACIEALSIMKAAKIPLVSLPYQPVPLYARAIRRLPEKILRTAFSKKARGGRGKKLASLHIDVLKGRKQTEASSLYGALIQKGEETKTASPVLAGLFALMVEYEKSGGNPEYFSRYRKKPEVLCDLLEVKS